MADLARRLEAHGKQFEVNAPFELDKQWYQKLSGTSFKRITVERAKSLTRQTKSQTPRALPSAFPPQSTQIFEPVSDPQLPSAEFTHQKDTGRASIAFRDSQTLPLRHAARTKQVEQPAKAEPQPQGSDDARLPRHQLPAKPIAISGARRPSVSKQSADNYANPGAPTAPRLSSSILSKSSQERHHTPPAQAQIAEDYEGTDFAVVTGLVKGFANIPEDEFAQRAIFLAENPELLDTERGNLLQEAVSQVLNNDVSAARQCMQSLVILSLCKNIKPEKLEARVLAMDYRDSDLGKKFKELYTTLARSVQELANKESEKRRRLAVPTHSDTQPELPNVGRNAQAGAQRSRQPTRPGYNARTSRAGGLDTEDETRYDLEHCLDNISQLATRTPGMKILPENIESEKVRKLSPSYKVPDNGARFFVQGRVFALLWHESEGQPLPRKREETDELTAPEDADNLGGNRVKGSFGVIIFSHIRRMVVIKNRKGYCWCLPVGSYGGLGLKKKGLKQEEIDAHAIIYDNRHGPIALKNEPGTTKRPIAVDMAAGQELSKASRLHFAKPCSVEWNTRVMDVGKVRPECIPALIGNAHLELFGDEATSRGQEGDR